VLGSVLLAAGSIIKTGCFASALGVSEMACVMLGTLVVGFSQPMYQCTPALLSSTWFPNNERTLATSLALNSNQLGIGFAFAVGVMWVSEPEDIPGYFVFLGAMCVVVSVLAFFLFKDAPPTPPSNSARGPGGGPARVPPLRVGSIAKKPAQAPPATPSPPVFPIAGTPEHPSGFISPISAASYQNATPTHGNPPGQETEEDGSHPGYQIDTSFIQNYAKRSDDSGSDCDSDEETVMRYDAEFLSDFFKPGFSHTVVAFAVSAIVINTVSTYMDALLAARGHSRAYTGSVGFAFQIVVMISSFFVGGYTDTTRHYYGVVMTLLVVGAGFLALCG
jgi:hypothetical protein